MVRSKNRWLLVAVELAEDIRNNKNSNVGTRFKVIHAGCVRSWPRSGPHSPRGPNTAMTDWRVSQKLPNLLLLHFHSCIVVLPVNLSVAIDVVIKQKQIH